MLRVTIDEYTLAMAEDFPGLYHEYHKHATIKTHQCLSFPPIL
jgi:hypothetical protein